MKHRDFFIVFIVSLLIVSLFLNYSFFVNDPSKSNTPSVFVGVDVAYDDLTEIKRLVDEISYYTNLFVIGSTGITYNVTKLDETCQYIYDKGLSFIIFTERSPQAQWLEDAKERWGNRFLGFYAFDEVGGRQLDLYKYRPVWEAANYTDARNQYVGLLNDSMNRIARYYTSSVNFPLFTSDYALYWFDYEAGYDVVFAEFGWNYSRQLNVALCRGAATVQNKDWGVMITWTYNNAPYIESGEELYNDMMLAYNNGAKYILVFNYPYVANSPYGILEEEHLEALKKFWNYAGDNPPTGDALSDRVAYVLPKDYGYGFRGPNDKIWGLWGADTLTNEICTDLSNRLEQYGSRLDIIYDDKIEPYNTSAYNKFIFWNGTVDDL